MKKGFFLISIILTGFCLSASLIELNTYFAEPRIEETGSCSRIIVPQTQQTGNIGLPSLPFRGIKVLLPPDEVIESVVISQEDPLEFELDNPLIPVQPPVNFS
ncbi:MAG: hypothetical protein JXB60_10175, partial [Candidatus Cloacimonetes bacterium]|nr:hypothetical protein [Candidatus Cloacimonadota bacterium]